LQRALSHSESAAQSPLVSVVIPCHGGEAFIRDAIESVLRQSHPNVELVVVDDASTDESWAIIGEYGKALVAERNSRNRGACYSRNRGAALACGRFLMFLDADDCITPDTIEALVGAMDAPGAGLAACKWSFFVRSGESWIPVESGFPEDPPGGDFLRAWLGGWYIPTCALLWRRTAFDETGGWDESLAANQDGDLALRALLSGMSIEQANGGLGLYRKQPGLQTTLSTTVSREAVTSRLRVFRNVEDKLESSGRLESYRFELGQSYYSLARQAYLVDIVAAQECEKRAWNLAGRRASSGTLSHRFLASLLGLRRKERLAKSIRSGIRGLRLAVGWPD
jgi:glycosyltransferase involved in cell wall biosynthesis